MGLGKLVAWFGGIAVVLAGCSSQSQRDAATEASSGNIGFSLTPVSGITLSSLHYVLTRAGGAGPVLEGDLPTPGTATTLDFALPIPVGTGYSLSISAVSQESTFITCLASFGPFSVSPNSSTRISLPLVCTQANLGTVGPAVTVGSAGCPRLVVDYVVSSSASAPVGGFIALSSAAHDLDGKSIGFSWSVSPSSAGSFAPANARESLFQCQSGGAIVPITLTASNGECSTSLSLSAFCVRGECGNGVLDLGESCDSSAPNGAPCLPNCTLPICGNGKVDAPFEQCDPVPADLANCLATCMPRPPVCGDGYLTLGEACDGNLFPPGTPAGSACSSSCSLTPLTSLCGDGLVQSQELCDPAFTVNDCGSDCRHITSAACRTCENQPDTCSDFVSCDAVPGNASAGPAAGVKRSTLCNQVLDCVRDSGCASGGAAPIRCYCGGVNSGQCQAGQGNGVCRSVIERGLETTSFNTVAQRFANVTFGGGMAMTRVDCDQTFCASQCFDGGGGVPSNPCGNGLLDNHEQCDPSVPGTPVGTCSTNCLFAPPCGNGLLEPGEQCDPSVPGTPPLSCTSTCVIAPPCGNGKLDAGEECDATAPGAPPSCNPSCKLPVCGNGIVEGLEQCDTLTSNPTCVNCQVHSECGDGFLSPAEQCDGALFPPDTPAGSVCTPQCTIAGHGECNDGVLSAGEFCDLPFSENCGSNCNPITKSTCFNCENSFDTCQDFTLCSAVSGNAAAGTPAAGTPRARLCNEALDCVRDSGCAANGNAPIRCYCGTAGAADCQAGLGNGVCKAQLERSLETTAFATIAQRIGNTTFGGGMAMARIDCDQTFCPAQCF